ncbi:MAG TPA: PQQ-dependent sugar dehydrogenase [Acidimicrobiia bacterium]|nr:PQQ-dependent sugar dehydrogenase [Acidimicrobiia bacterium]
MNRRVALPFVVLIAVACSDGSPANTTASQAVTAPPASAAPSVPSTRPPTPAEPTTSVVAEMPTSTSSVTSTTLPELRALAYGEAIEADFPIVLTARPGDDFALLAERSGTIYRFADGKVGDQVGDLTGRTITNGERGLLGMVRHPQDDSRVFVHYSDPEGDTIVSEFRFDGIVDVSSERVLLSVEQPAANHNGGMIQFGPDGALYVGLGDGGASDDAFGHGQNPDTLLGGIVRLDPEGGDPRLWQYGLRNPWRFWIDGEDIWIADVGQDSYEEIDLAPIAADGINYGWSIMEGAHCFNSSSCDQEGLTLPLVEIERGDGGSCSITGGVVYRGTAIPELDGRFLFSDYCGGYLRSVDRSGRVSDHTEEVGQAGAVVSFGMDGRGEVYVLTTDQVLPLVPKR